MNTLVVAISPIKSAVFVGGNAIIWMFMEKTQKTAF